MSGLPSKQQWESVISMERTIRFESDIVPCISPMSIRVTPHYNEVETGQRLGSFVKDLDSSSEASWVMESSFLNSAVCRSRCDVKRKLSTEVKLHG
jgi:hypothetical protein